MKSSGVLGAAAILSIILARCLAQPVYDLLRRGGLMGRNFRGELIPVGMGLLIFLAVAPSALLLLLFLPPGQGVAAELLLLHGMALIGLLDDALGDGQVRGLRGHLGGLRRGLLTTGAVKAVYGGGVALLSVLMLPGKSWPARLLSAAVIALAANAINLFDLRPGRALKVFFFLYGSLVIVGGQLGHLGFLVVAAAVVVAPLDLAGRAMLGDSGANILGGMLGFFAVSTLSWRGELICLFLLISLHAYAEKASISALVERNHFLTWLDSLGR